MSDLVIDTLEAVGTRGRLNVIVYLSDLNGEEVTGFTSLGVELAILTARTDADGHLTLDVYPNADVDRPNTYWTVLVGGDSFLILKSGSSQTLQAAIVVDPDELGPAGASVAALNAEIVARTAADVALQADIDAVAGGVTQQEMDDAIAANSDGDRGYADAADMTNLAIAESYADSLAPNYDPAGAAAAAQAAAVQRANHTGTQDFTTITGVATDAQIPAAVARDAEVTAAVAAAIAALIASAPGALDTLDELAAALGDDPSFATTVTNSIATKVAKSLYDANTILAANTDDNPAALTVAQATIVGRLVGGNIAALSTAQIRTLINVEDGATADQTAIEILALVGNATTSASGFVELATNAETATGTDATRAVTPAGLASTIVPAIDSQEFVGSGSFTWTKPATGSWVRVEIIGAGNPGASGRKGLDGGVRGGGGGAAGGAHVVVWFPIGALTATVAIVNGALGTPGAAVTAASTNGNAGTSSGLSSFGAFVATIPQVLAPGGGTTAAGSAGSNFGLAPGGVGGAGGAAAVPGAGAFGAAPGFAEIGPTGGGGGGGITAANAAQAGALGGQCVQMGEAAGAGGGAAGVVGVAGADRSATKGPGSGGGGGGASTTGNAGAGGAGGDFGGAGGGGGAAKDAVGNSGAGGAAGRPYMRVDTY